jgi:alpha-tubulin suppressor-like RCC1 family protein
MEEVKDRLRAAVTDPGPTRLERRRQLAMRALVLSFAAALVGAGAALIWSSRQREVEPPGETRHSDGGQISLPGGKLTVFSGPPCPFTNEPVSSVVLAGALNEFGIVLRPGGEVQAWGDNRFGQTEIPFGLSSVVAVAAGRGRRSAHALALQADGTVVGWGDNTFGQASAPAGLTNVISIAAGEFFSMALTRAGRVVAWGNRNRKVSMVPENLPPAKAITAGAEFAAALLQSGQVRAWGRDDAGQCQVPQVSGSVAEIAAGERHMLARLDNGRLIAWGDNEEKQCEVPAGLPTVAAIWAGGDCSAALDSAGTLHLWGDIPGRSNARPKRVVGLTIGSSSWAAIVREDGN